MTDNIQHCRVSFINKTKRASLEPSVQQQHHALIAANTCNNAFNASANLRCSTSQNYVAINDLCDRTASVFVITIVSFISLFVRASLFRVFLQFGGNHLDHCTVLFQTAYFFSLLVCCQFGNRLIYFVNGVSSGYVRNNVVSVWSWETARKSNCALLPETRWTVFAIFTSYK